jgi:hypothetical protein
MARSNGDVIAAWDATTSSTLMVAAAVRSAGSTHWPASQTFGPGLNVGPSSLAVAPSGGAVLIWTTHIGAPDTKLRFAMLGASSRRFSAVHEVPPEPHRLPAVPLIVATPSGEFVAIWEAQSDGTTVGTKIASSRLPAGSRHWTPPVIISGSDTDTSPEALTTAEDGSVLAAWTSSSGVWVRRLCSGVGRFAPAQHLSTSPGRNVRLVSGADGTLAVVWSSGEAVMASVVPPGADRFPLPRRIDRADPHTEANDLSVAVAPSGTVTAIWTDLLSHARVISGVASSQLFGLYGTSYSATFPAHAKAWSSAKQFWPSGDSDGPVEIALTGSGTVLAVWSGAVGKTNGVAIYAVSRHDGAPHWSRSVSLAGPRTSATSITLNPQGSSIFVAWSDSAGLLG